MGGRKDCAQLFRYLDTGLLEECFDSHPSAISSLIRLVELPVRILCELFFGGAGYWLVEVALPPVTCPDEHH